jgi:hypothetical protein
LIKDDGEREAAVERLMDACEKSERKKGMSADVKPVVIGVDGRPGEKLAPDVDECFLGGAEWSGLAGA